MDPKKFSWAQRVGAKAGNRFLAVTIAVPGSGAAISRPLLETEDPQVGFIIAKRQVARAVDRNRLKRRLRHLVKGHLPGLPLGTVVVIRAFGQATALSGEELAAQLDDALSRAQKKALSAEWVQAGLAEVDAR